MTLFSEQSLPLFVIRSLLARLRGARDEIVWVSIGQVLAFAGAFATIKILTVALGPKTYGVFALGMTLAGLCNMFVYGPMSQAVLRFFSICRDRGQLGAYFRVLDRIYLAAGLGLAAMALLAAAGTGIAMGRDWATVVAAALALGIATGINSYIVSVLSALRRRTAVAFFQGLDAWLKPLVALPFLLVAGRDAAVALAGFFCATLIVSAAQYPASIRARTASPGQPESPALRREIRSEVVRYAASFAAFSAFGAISTYADRWIVLGVAGEHDLGVYAAMYQVANAPFVVVVGIITQLITPALFDRAGGAESAAAIEHSDRLLAHSIAASIAIMGAMVACGWLLARPLMMLLTSSDFAERSSLLGPIMLSLAIFQVGQLHSLKGLVHRSPEIYFWPKALQALALLVIGYALMKLFGIEGLVLALNLSALAYLASVLIANRKLAVMR